MIAAREAAPTPAPIPAFTAVEVPLEAVVAPEVAVAWEALDVVGDEDSEVAKDSEAVEVSEAVDVSVAVEDSEAVDNET